MRELPVENGQVLLPAVGITLLIRTIFCAAGGSEEEAEVISQHLDEGPKIPGPWLIVQCQ